MFRNRPKVPPALNYHVSKGARGIARPEGGVEWFAHEVKTNRSFNRVYEEDADTLTFKDGGWLLRLAKRDVVASAGPRPKKPVPAKHDKVKTKAAKAKEAKRWSDLQRSRDPLMRAQARALARQKPSGVGEVVAPGSGVDSWRESD